MDVVLGLGILLLFPFVRYGLYFAAFSALNVSMGKPWLRMGMLSFLTSIFFLPAAFVIGSGVERLLASVIGSHSGHEGAVAILGVAAGFSIHASFLCLFHISIGLGFLKHFLLEIFVNTGCTFYILVASGIYFEKYPIR